MLLYENKNTFYFEVLYDPCLNVIVTRVDQHIKAWRHADKY